METNTNFVDANTHLDVLKKQNKLEEPSVHVPEFYHYTKKDFKNHASEEAPKDPKNNLRDTLVKISETLDKLASATDEEFKKINDRIGAIESDLYSEEETPEEASKEESKKEEPQYKGPITAKGEPLVQPVNPTLVTPDYSVYHQPSMPSTRIHVNMADIVTGHSRFTPGNYNHYKFVKVGNIPPASELPELNSDFFQYQLGQTVKLFNGGFNPLNIKNPTIASSLLYSYRLDEYGYICTANGSDQFWFLGSKGSFIELQSEEDFFKQVPSQGKEIRLAKLRELEKELLMRLPINDLDNIQSMKFYFNRIAEILR